MTRQWIWLAAACGAFALAGGCNCGNPGPNTHPGDDGGTVLDAGDDAGEALDAGDDAGVIPDAGDDDAGMDADGGLDGGDDAGMEGDAGTDAGVTPNTLCADVAAKMCDFFIRCSTAGDLEARFGNNPLNQGRPNDQVTAQMRAECEAFEADLGCDVLVASFENGRATFDPVKYDQCIDAAYPAGTCARDLNQVASACIIGSFLTANTGNGSLCTFDGECTNGYCAKTGANACGTCTAYVANGQKCPNGTECDPATSYCTTAINPNNRQCAAIKAAGQSCQTDFECGPGNVCRTATGNIFNFTCAPGVPLGDACTGGHYECLRAPISLIDANAFPTAICSSQSGAGTCIATQSTPGGVCGTGEQFSVFNTAHGPICNETETCLAAVCSPRRAAGLPCDDDGNCVGGTHCVNKTCTAYKELGDACSSNGQCKNFMNCQGATCQPVISALGEACNGTQPCAEGYCDSGTNTCAPLKADGETCGGNGECASLLCMAGSCTSACWQ